MSSNEIDAIYGQLLKRYEEKGFLTPKAALDSQIRGLMLLGKTREEAIRGLNSSDSPWSYSPWVEVNLSQGKEIQARLRDMRREEIFLDRMNGYQFQEFVASLFQKLGFYNVVVSPAGADEGIDIRMEQKTEVGAVRYVVECKHQAEHIIGRPVVQKLHSALITKSMNKGIIVTSGHFSSDAMHYAEDVGIELVDIKKLKELANKAGLAVCEASVPVQVVDNCFPVSEEASIAYSCCSYLKSKLVGFQDGMAKVEEVNLALLSAYMIDYSIHARFSTSLGVIHSVDANSTMFMDGEDLHTMDGEVTAPFARIGHTLSEIHEEQLKAKLVEKGGFRKSFSEVREYAVQELIQSNTQTVSYYGKNNIRYSKTCVPSKKDIIIKDMKRVYIPIWTIGFSILKNKYVVSATETSGRLNVLRYRRFHVKMGSDFDSYPSYCLICQADVRDEAYLCSECGAIVCKEDIFSCKACGKAICRKDASVKRKYIILTEKFCPECAKSKGLVKKET